MDDPPDDILGRRPRPARGNFEVPGPPPCAVEVGLEVLGGKWRVIVVAALKQREMQHGELRRAVPRISQKELTRCLRELEADGLVERTELPGRVRRVRYGLTPRGQGLSGVLQAIYDFGLSWAAEQGLTVAPPIGR